MKRKKYCVLYHCGNSIVKKKSVIHITTLLIKGNYYAGTITLINKMLYKLSGFFVWLFYYKLCSNTPTSDYFNLTQFLTN